MRLITLSLLLLHSPFYPRFFAAASQVPEEQLDLWAAKSLWEAQDTTSYEYLYQQSCFCTDEYRSQKRVSVESNEIVSVVTLDGLPVSDAVKADVRTILELFDLIQGAIDTPADSLVVEYNTDFGYPESVAIDYSFGIADEEIYITIEGLTFGTSGGGSGGNEYEELQATLNANRNAWSSRNLAKYTYDFQLSCFCTPPFTSLKRVEINNGQRANVVEVSTGAPVTDQNILGVVKTIDEVFDAIQDAIDTQADEITVTYNPDYGYPENLAINYDFQIADEELYISISNIVDLDNVVPSSVVEEYEAALALWNDQGLSEYEFVYFQGCLACFGPVRTVVQGDAVTSVEVVDDSFFDDTLTTSYAKTINELFATIKAAIDTNAQLIQIVYNVDYGYPEEIYINYDIQIQDEEFFVTVSQFSTTISGGGDDASLAAYLAAREKWEGLGIVDYRIRYSQSCLVCYTPYEVIVQNGDVTSVEALDPIDDTVPTAADVNTIDGLFDAIFSAIDSGAEKVNVTYSATYGFPESIYIDYSFMIADEELGVSISNFVELEDLDQVLEDLTAARLLWSQVGFTDYEYDFKTVCFCPPPFNLEKHVKVQGGSVTSATLDGEPVDDQVLSSIKTIEELFTTIEEAINENAVTINVQYNVDYGYPESIFIDRDVIIADEEYGASVKNLVEITDGPDVPDTGSDLEDELVAARHLWKSAGFTSYTFTFDRSCYCDALYTGLFHVTVQDGYLTQVTKGESGALVDYQVQATIGTIDQTFDLISSYLATNPFDATATFNADSGYPEYIKIDWYDNYSGDDFIIEISNVAALDGGGSMTSVTKEQDLMDARAVWESYGIKNYVIGVHKRCSCSYEYIVPMWVHVYNGSVINAVTVNEQTPVSSDVLASLSSVTQLFDMIADAIGSDANSISVTYDETYGYPENVFIDYDASDANDHITVDIFYFAETPSS